MKYNNKNRKAAIKLLYLEAHSNAAKNRHKQSSLHNLRS